VGRQSLGNPTLENVNDGKTALTLEYVRVRVVDAVSLGQCDGLFDQLLSFSNAACLAAEARQVVTLLPGVPVCAAKETTLSRGIGIGCGCGCLTVV